MAYDEIRTKKVYLSGSEGEATATIEDGEMKFEAVAPKKTITSIKVNHKYQTNEVHSNDDLIVGNAYWFNMNKQSFYDYFSTENSGVRLRFYNVIEYNFSNLNLSDDDTIFSSEGTIGELLTVDVAIDVPYSYLELNVVDAEYFKSYAFDIQRNVYIQGYCILDNFYNVDNSFYTCFTSASFIPIESVEVTYSDGTTEIIH